LLLLALRPRERLCTRSKTFGSGLGFVLRHAMLPTVSNSPRLFARMGSFARCGARGGHIRGPRSARASLELFERVFAAKVRGAWNLHELTKDAPVDLFLLMSSASALLGGAGMANYVASNCAVDALAHYRRRHGMPALSVNWGLWPIPAWRLRRANRATVSGRTGAGADRRGYGARSARPGDRFRLPQCACWRLTGHAFWRSFRRMLCRRVRRFQKRGVAPVRVNRCGKNSRARPRRSGAHCWSACSGRDGTRVGIAQAGSVDIRQGFFELGWIR